ncbi:hypothetical protein D3C81_2051530 [compost metagenome]
MSSISVCVITAAAASVRMSSGNASASGNTTSELRVALLNVTERASATGKRSSRAEAKPSTGASSMKPMYTGITGSRRSKSRTTTAICEPITATSTSAIAGTGIHAQA